jgi:hypothetical protein
MPVVINGDGTITGYTPTITTSMLPVDSVIQTKFAKSTSSGTWQQSGLGNTASNWDDIPNLSINITPTSNSSKILVLAHACGGEQSHLYGLWFRVIRDTTPLGGDVATSGQTNRSSVGFGMGSNSTYTDDQMGSASFSYMDEPASASQLTYKVQGICRYSPHQWSYNRSYDGNDSGAFAQGVSTLTLLEVKG